MKTYIFLIAAFFLVSCEKTDPGENKPVTFGSVSVQVNHLVASQLLRFDTILYQNAAGNKYSVTRLHYYISGIRFYQSDRLVHTDRGVYYVDASSAAATIALKNVPASSYTGLSLLIGLDSSQNISGSLPAVIEHINMAWPDEMGGGYHFLKLEGHYLNNANAEKGFTVHLGTQMALVRHSLITKSFTVNTNQQTSLSLEMNINEWFENPYLYNFNTDGNYTMGVGPLMQKISNNGKDVFTLQ